MRTSIQTLVGLPNRSRRGRYRPVTRPARQDREIRRAVRTACRLRARCRRRGNAPER